MQRKRLLVALLAGATVLSIFAKPANAVWRNAILETRYFDYTWFPSRDWFGWGDFVVRFYIPAGRRSEFRCRSQRAARLLIASYNSNGVNVVESNARYYVVEVRAGRGARQEVGEYAWWQVADFSAEIDMEYWE